MKRIQAFEFEDLKWFPKSLRNYGTDFLEAGANTFDIYAGVMPVLLKGLEKSRNKAIVDMGSGGGGGLTKIAQRLKREVPQLKIFLTDYYPNLTAFERTKAKQPDTFEYVEQPVDARKVPTELKGFRTQFLSYHHFRPADATAILQNAVDSGQAIGIFEAQQRNGKNLLQRLFSPLAVLVLTPFIRPFKTGRIVFTYLLPIVPLFVLWDGIVSVLRAYTVKEMKLMIAGVRNHHLFNWEINVVKGKAGEVLYLLGTPK